MSEGGALREVFASFGFDFEHDKLQRANDGVSELFEKVKGVGVLLAGNFVVEGIHHFSEQLNVFKDISRQTGVATDDLQQLSFAMRLNGGSTEEMTASITSLQRALGHTAEAAASPQLKALKALKIDVKEGSNVKDVLPQIFDNFAGIASEAKQAEVAQQLFGRAGVRMLPTLRLGAKGMAQLREEMGELGGPVSEKAIEDAEAFDSALVKLDTAFFALKGTLGAGFFPQFAKVLTGLGKGVGFLSDWVKQTTLADTGVEAFSVTLGLKLAKSLAPFLKEGLKFTGIFLAVDDLLGFLRGQDSEIGALIDAIWGDGAQEPIRNWATKSLGVLRDFGVDALRGFPAWRAGLADIWNYIALDFDVAILNMQRSWNEFVGGLHLPDAVKRALRIDDSASVLRVQAAQVAKAGSEARVDSEQARLNGEVAPGVAGQTVRQGRTVAQFSAASEAPRLLLPGAHQLGPLAPEAIGAPVLPGLPGSSFPNLVTEAPSLSGQGARVENHVEVHTPITIQLPPGTGPEVARAAGRSAQTAVQTERRAALQALAQKGKK